MNREKYTHNPEYREGYDECLTDNNIKVAMLLKTEIEPIIKQLQTLYDRMVDIVEEQE